MDSPSRPPIFLTAPRSSAAPGVLQSRSAAVHPTTCHHFPVSRASNDMDVEVRGPQYAPQAHPQRQKHLRATRVGDVAKVDNVGGLPAEPFAEPVGDFAFGR